MPGDEGYPYDMSVIVPVYNAAEHLSRCVASLDAQTMPQDRFEVVLVNDGSTDGSLDSCRSFAVKRPNYVVVDQENQGVSGARNKGISASHGRYLMFLDPDDELTKPSIEALVDAFEHMGGQVDLLTYPLTYHEAGSGYEHQHKRQTWLTKTGVYDLNEFPFIAQTTVNVCVKNQGDDTPRFDKSLRLCEDQRFNTDILASKAAIAYCSEAGYVYWRYDGTSAATRHLSCDTFDGIVRNYEHFIDLAEAHDAFARYAHALVIYDTSWRIRQHELLPHDVDDEALGLCQQRMDAVLARIPRDCWLESPYLSDTLRIYQLRCYGKLGEVEGTSYDAEGTTFHLNGGEDLRVDPPSVVIDWLLRRPDGMTMKGYVYGPSFVFEDKPSLSVRVGGKTATSDLRPSRCGDEHTGIDLTKAWRFETSLPPMEKAYDVSFALQLGDTLVPTIKLVFDLQRCNGRYIDAKKREFRDRRASIKGQTLHVGTIKDLPAWTMPLARMVMQHREEGRPGNYDHELVASLRARLPKEVAAASRRRVWLYDDGPVGQVSLTQMLDDIQLRDRVTRLYVADNEKAAAAVQLLGGMTVGRGSFDHVLWFLQAEKVFSATNDLEGIIPCDRAVFERVRDYTREGQQYMLVSEDLDRLDSTAFDCGILPQNHGTTSLEL